MLLYYKMNFAPMNQSEINSKIDLLPSHLKNRVLKYATIQKQQQRLESFFLIKDIISENNFDFDLSQIRYTSKGKPFINNQYDFGIAYSNNNVAIGISKNHNIGIDLEEIKDIVVQDYRDYFSDKEFALILSSKDSFNTFFRLWTRKEAVTKALGLGAFLNFKSFEVLNEILTIKNKTIVLCSEIIFENFWLSTATTQKSFDKN